MISSTTNWTQATITSLPQTITVPFVFTNTSDLLVQDSRTSPPLTLALGSDYTVSGGGGAVGSIAVVSTGSNAVLLGEIITISRLVPETQTTGFVNGGFLNPAQIENALDKLTEQTQQIGNTVSKSLQFQNDETLSGVIPLTARKSKYLAFDANGNISLVAGSLIGNSPSFLTLGVGAAAPVSGGTGGSVIITPVPASSTAVAAVNVQGSLNAPASTDLHPNAFRDTTIFTPVVNGDAYASYDTYATLSGTTAPNHFYGYQARIAYSGSGTFGGPMAAFATLNMGVAGTGSVPFMRGFYVSNPSVSGGGSCGQFDGIYIDQLSAATANNAIYIAGNNRLFMAGGQILTSDLLANIEGATTARVQACFDQTSQTGYAVKNKNSTGTGVCYGVYNNGGTYQGGIVQTNTTTTAFPTSSDSRLKENVRNLADVGSIIDSIQPVVFDWRWGGKDAHGFIAQELYAAYAPAVHVGEDDADGKMERPWGVDYSKLVPILTAEIKSLRARLTAIGA